MCGRVVNCHLPAEDTSALIFLSHFQCIKISDDCSKEVISLIYATF
jgi:hypothetical protein